MRLLVLGGTKFLGRAAVEAALARGHEVTLFNRGETNPELFPEAEKLRGDRTADLECARRAASGMRCSTRPATSRRSCAPRRRRWSTRQRHYLFVSSVSVYASLAAPVDEESPVAELGELPDDKLTEDYSNYGPLKALCEQAVADVFGERHASVRPGLIVGANDPTGRFTYWPHRVARGGRVLAPAPPEAQVQFIDAKDLGAWLVDLSERQAGGVYNATHPGRSWRETLETCREVSGSDATFEWVPDDVLNEHEVGEWMELPLWISDPGAAAMHEVDVSRAVAAGLTFRPLDQTVRDTLEHAATVDGVGLTPEREAELLAAAQLVGLAGACPARVVAVDLVRVDPARLGEVERQQLEADDVGDRMHGRDERRLAAELAQGRGRAGRALGRPALALEHEGANRLVDRGEMAVQELLGLVRLGRDVRALAQLQHRLLRGRPVAPGAGDEPALVGADRLAVLERALDEARQAGDLLAVQRGDRRHRARVARRVAPALLDLRRRDDDLVGELAERAVRLAGHEPDRAFEGARGLERELRVALVADDDERVAPRAAAARARAPAPPSRRSAPRGTRCRSRCAAPVPRAAAGRPELPAASRVARRSRASSLPPPPAEHLASRRCSYTVKPSASATSTRWATSTTRSS